MDDWNPEMYLQFRSERTQPSIDLASRINSEEPASIIDVGCGPGNSTQVLAHRWPEANITGLDRSSAMINQARQDYPDQEWIVADLMSYEPETEYDIVFSNAVIQWIPNHGALLEKISGMLSNNGLVAIQIPLFWDMPLGKIISRTAGGHRWKKQTEGVSDLLTIHDYSYYYDHLSRRFKSIEIWETQYMHVLDNHFSIVQMMRSTGLKPYLDRLDDPAKIADFEMQVLKSIETAYPEQLDGKVLLPFRRLFFIGAKPRN